MMFRRKKQKAVDSKTKKQLNYKWMSSHIVWVCVCACERLFTCSCPSPVATIMLTRVQFKNQDMPHPQRWVCSLDAWAEMQAKPKRKWIKPKPSHRPNDKKTDPFFFEPHSVPTAARWRHSSRSPASPIAWRTTPSHALPFYCLPLDEATVGA